MAQRNGNIRLCPISPQNVFLLTAITPPVVPYILCGDINIKLLQHSSSSRIHNCIETCKSYNCQNLITRPTRVTTTSASLIDHFDATVLLNWRKSWNAYQRLFRSFTGFYQFSKCRHKLKVIPVIFLYSVLLLALYNYNGLVAPRLSLYNFWIQFTQFVFVFWVSSLQLFRTPWAW